VRTIRAYAELWTNQVVSARRKTSLTKTKARDSIISQMNFFQRIAETPIYFTLAVEPNSKADKIESPHWANVGFQAAPKMTLKYKASRVF